MQSKVEKEKTAKAGMRGSLRVGKLAGIQVFIHWTFVLLIAYVIYSNYRRGYDAMQIGWALLFILSIFVVIVLHELGHALAARRYGIKTSDITLLPIGGLARLERMPEKPSEELVVAAAGPAVNVVLAAVTWLFIDFPADAGQLNTMISEGINAQNFFLNFFAVNVWLVLFNLIPAFPMDGGRILRALLAFRLTRPVATSVAARIGQVLALVFIFAGFFINPFLIFVGLFVFIGAKAENEQTQTQSLLHGFTVNDVTMHEIPRLNASDPVRVAVDEILNGQNKNFLVVENEEPVGTLSRDEVIEALSERGDQELIRNIMNRELITVSGDRPLDQVYQNAVTQRFSLILVKEAGRLKGVLDLENILEFILIRQATRATGPQAF